MSRLWPASPRRRYSRTGSGIARRFAAERNVAVVLKGDRTIIAVPGRPSLGQPDRQPGPRHRRHRRHPDRPDRGTCSRSSRTARNRPSPPPSGCTGAPAKSGGAELGEKAFLATDILRFLPEAMRAVASGLRRPPRKRPSPSADGSRPSFRPACGDPADRQPGRRQDDAGQGHREGLGAAAADEVSSPTFTLIHEYGAAAASTTSICTAWRPPPKWRPSVWTRSSTAKPSS